MEGTSWLSSLFSLRLHLEPDANTANWKRRTQLIEYCVGVVDQSIEEKRKGIEDENLDPSSRRKMQAEMYGEEVRVSC